MAIPVEIATTIADPKSYADLPRLDQAFEYLRHNAPFETAEIEGFDPFRVVSRHADLADIETRADVFVNGAASTYLVNREAIAFGRTVVDEPNVIRSLVNVDGREHKDLRAIAFPAFTPKALKSLEDSTRDIAREFIDAMIARGPEVDFAKDVAFLYPLRVVMAALGVPREDEPFMLKLTQEMFGNTDPDMNRGQAEVSGAAALQVITTVHAELTDYFERVTTQLRSEPRDNINSLIANAKINGEYLTPRQLMGYYIIAATAGHDTTANTTGATMWAIAENPELLDQIRNDPDLLPGFLEESIRWSTPVKHFMRSALVDTEVRGKPVKAGEWLFLSYHSANRDEEVFADPYTFRLDRPLHRQLAFGTGPHVCLGQHLARMEMRILWEELLPRLRKVELTGTPKLSQSNFVSGPKSVPVRITVN
jgi:cytochrome P450